jgi:hypothetical protein
MTRESPAGARPVRSPFLDVVPVRLHIFVPALMSVGFVFWLTALTREQLRRRRAVTLERRAAAAGETAAAILVGGRVEEAGLAGLDRSSDRRLSLLLSLPFVGLAIYVLVGAGANYLRPGGYVSEIAWLLALSVILGGLFAATGLVLMLVAARGPRVPAAVRRAVARVPILASSPEGSPFAEPSPRLTGALVVTASMAALAAMVVGSSRGFLGRVDEPLLDAATDAAWRISAMSI